MPLTFGVVGYSTRALVQALTDLGHSAIAWDAFGDHDLVALAKQVHVVDEWPQEIASTANHACVDAWLLGGGMENCPEIVEELRKRRPILGPSPTELVEARRHEFWQSLCESGIGWPDTRQTAPEQDDGRWLTKSSRGAGGTAVQTWRGDPSLDQPEVYWQRRVDGRVLGVTWCLSAGGCSLLGVTQSLDQHDWPGPSEFIYRGSIGPVVLKPEHAAGLTKLGRRFARALPEYRGILQADVIEDRSQRLWLLELNPRWTSGMEILHEASRTTQHSPLAEHLAAWGIRSRVTFWDKPALGLFTKAIYYSRAETELTPDMLRSLTRLRSWQKSKVPALEWNLADLPNWNSGGEAGMATAPARPGGQIDRGGSPVRFAAGMPILTVRCRARL